MTEAVDPQTAELYIARLKKEILGDEWCTKQVVQYKEFYEQYSYPDMWSHRLPAVSPIVPLLFQHQYVNQRKMQSIPIGYWYGDPIYFLRNLAISVFMFEDYWSKLPNNNGVGNIRYKLSDAGQFNGFLFELTVASDAKLWTFKDYIVEPVFLNPASYKGGPDIVLHKDTNGLAIQCKTRSPSSATNLPFDLFQYFFGCFVRNVYDSGHSYKLIINLKAKLNISDIDKLLTKVCSAVKVGIDLPTHTVNSSYELKLTKLKVPISGLSRAKVKEIIDNDRGNLCTEIFASNPFGKKETGFNRIAITSVSTVNAISFEEFFLNTIAEAAVDAQTSIPSILAVQFYGSIGLEGYMINSTDANRLRKSVDRILKNYTRVIYVDISSNRQEYEELADGSTVTHTQHIQIKNKYFAG